jgi:4-diphosphocytidyl-2-C-methyl-D-erythritol kinase
MAASRHRLGRNSGCILIVRVQVLAPAKINLGLEILGKRADGFHELHTVFCAVSLFDRIFIDTDEASCGGSLPFGNLDLAVKAQSLASGQDAVFGQYRVQIEKRIPVSAGLGGGSSDAAGTLRGLQSLHPDRMSYAQAFTMATELGSDVPFLLNGGIAAATSRGELLEPLPFASFAVVLICFDLQITEKTRTMFGQLDASDFSDRARIGGIAESLRSMRFVGSGQAMPNAFQRALYHLFPEVARVANAIEVATGLAVNVTGAGPSLYVLQADMERALSLRMSIRNVIGSRTDVRLFCARSVSRIPMTGPNHD